MMHNFQFCKMKNSDLHMQAITFNFVENFLPIHDAQTADPAITRSAFMAVLKLRSIIVSWMQGRENGPIAFICHIRLMQKMSHN